MAGQFIVSFIRRINVYIYILYNIYKYILYITYNIYKLYIIFIYYIYNAFTILSLDFKIFGDVPK